MTLTRWMYRGDRPRTLVKILNRGRATLYAWGICPNYLVTLEVVGRKSGESIDFPLVLTVMEGERYLVSMLGKDMDWICNIKAAGSRAMLRHGISEKVRLEEVAVEQRAPILKAYLQRAPEARPHIPVSKDAPIAEFEKIAAQFPVFRLQTTI